MMNHLRCRSLEEKETQHEYVKTTSNECLAHRTQLCSSFYACPFSSLGRCYSFRCPSVVNRESDDPRALWTFSGNSFCPSQTKSSHHSLTSHRSWIHLRRWLDRKRPVQVPDLWHAVLVDVRHERVERIEREDLW